MRDRPQGCITPHTHGCIFAIGLATKTCPTLEPEANISAMSKIPIALTCVAFVGLSACISEDIELEPRQDLEICNYSQMPKENRSCIVDGDTIWLSGVNLRLKDFDTPESHRNLCGGQSEFELANRATLRLKELLGSYLWTIETFGIDGTGERRLATIRIDGRDVGDILISEGLARRWPDGDEFWCS